MRTYNLFISHSWTYGDQYERLVNLLQARGYFAWRNCSVPKNDPLHTNGTNRELYNAIKNQISPSSVVLILAGVYSTYSNWIDKEIHIAQNEFYTQNQLLPLHLGEAKERL